MMKPRPALRRSAILSVIVGLGPWAAPAPTLAQASFTDSERRAIERMIHDYVMNNPEVILESVQRMRAREQAADEEKRREILAGLRPDLERDPGSHVGGNPDGDVAVVEFFDYRCAYCKRFFPHLAELLRGDPNVRVVFKEYPILGPNSVTASRAALAARMQDGDLYMPFHTALMEARGALSERRILDIAKEIGLDPDRLARDMTAPEIEAAISRNRAQAEALGIQGTPAFVIGDEIVPGYIDGARLAALVEEARENCRTC